MEACHCLEVFALPRHVQHHSASETIADRRDLFRVHGLLLFKKIHGRLEPFLCNREVLHGLGRELNRVIGMRCGLPFAVHVHCQGRVAQLRKHPCAFSGILVQSPPFMYHKHARPLAFDVLVIGKVTFHGHPARLVVNCFTLDLGGSETTAANSNTIVRTRILQ